MRLATYLALVLLAVLSVAAGQLRLALGLAAAKSLLVGWEFMELRTAAWPHRLAFAAFVAGLAAVLWGLS